MANLYEIRQELIDTFDYEVDLETGECLSEEELKKKLDEIEMELSEKIENIGRYIKNLESDVESFKVEQKKLMTRRKTVENKLEGLKKYLDSFLKLQCTKEDGIIDLDKLRKVSKNLSTPTCAISYRKSEKVEVNDLSKVPDTCIKPRVIKEEDVVKDSVKEYINKYIEEHKSEDNPNPENDIDFAKLVTNINMSIK